MSKRTLRMDSEKLNFHPIAIDNIDDSDFEQLLEDSDYDIDLIEEDKSEPNVDIEISQVDQTPKKDQNQKSVKSSRKYIFERRDSIELEDGEGNIANKKHKTF